jgi:hypothetical protein
MRSSGQPLQTKARFPLFRCKLARQHAKKDCRTAAFFPDKTAAAKNAGRSLRVFIKNDSRLFVRLARSGLLLFIPFMEAMAAYNSYTCHKPSSSAPI